MRTTLVIGSCVLLCSSIAYADQQDATNAALTALAQALEAQKATIDSLRKALRASVQANASGTPSDRTAAVQAIQSAQDAAIRGNELEKKASDSVSKATQPPDPHSASRDRQWQVMASQNGGTASVTLSLDSRTDGTFDLQKSRGGSSYNDITLSAPLSKSTDKTTLGTLDGLAKAASIEFSHRAFFPTDGEAFYSYLTMWGVGAKFGVQQFSYYDATTLAKQTTTKAPDSLSAYLARELRADLIVFGKIAYQNTYADAVNQVKCQSLVSTLSCVSGPIGGPPRTTQRIFSAGVHATNVLNALDLAPQVSYDNDSKVKGIDVPIFIWGSGTGAKPAELSAGVDIAWRSDTHGSIGVFVGAPFSYWGF